MGDDQKLRSRAEFQSCASATDPDPNPYQHTPSSPLCVFTTGYRRLASIISLETQSASKGQLRRRGSTPCFWHISTLSVRKARRQSLWQSVLRCTRHLVKPCWWNCDLCVRIHTSKFHSGIFGSEIRMKGWIWLGTSLWYFVLTRCIRDQKKRQKIINKGREKTRIRKGEWQ